MKTKNLLHIYLTLCILTPALAQSPQKGPLKELKHRRTLNSKTFYNQRNDTYTTRISAGYLHYRDENGKLKEINNNIRFNKDGSARVDRGLYQARFNAVSSQKNKYDVIYELPRPVKEKRRKGRPATRLKWKVRSLGYFDRSSKAYQVLQEAEPVEAVTGDTIVGMAFYTEVNGDRKEVIQYTDTLENVQNFLKEIGKKLEVFFEQARKETRNGETREYTTVFYKIVDIDEEN